MFLYYASDAEDSEELKRGWMTRYDYYDHFHRY